MIKIATLATPSHGHIKAPQNWIHNSTNDQGKSRDLHLLSSVPLIPMKAFCLLPVGDMTSSGADVNNFGAQLQVAVVAGGLI